MRKNAAHIREFGEELQNFIDRSHPMEDFGMTVEPDTEIDKILSDVGLAVNVTAEIAKEVEYFINGDINRATFLRRYKEIEGRINTKLA